MSNDKNVLEIAYITHPPAVSAWLEIRLLYMGLYICLIVENIKVDINRIEFEYYFI